MYKDNGLANKQPVEAYDRHSPSKAYSVYFYYDKANDLLYIGKAVDVGARWRSHQESWKKDTVRIDVLFCDSKDDMDFLEDYFIKKIPSKHNKSGIPKSYITHTIPDLPKPESYTVEAFENKFCKKSNQSTSEQNSMFTMEEKLIAMGNQVVDVDGDVNLYDAKWLCMDLDRVIFRHQGQYLFSIYANLPGKSQKKQEQALSFRTNEVIRALNWYFNETDLQIMPGEFKGQEIHTFTFSGTKEELWNFVDLVNKASSLYDTRETRMYRGKEYFSHDCYCIQIISLSHASLISENFWKVEMHWLTKEEYDHKLRVNADTYTFPFKHHDFNCDTM